jgi:hypothetical protein
LIRLVALAVLAVGLLGAGGTAAAADPGAVVARLPEGASSAALNPGRAAFSYGASVLLTADRTSPAGDRADSLPLRIGGKGAGPGNDQYHGDVDDVFVRRG